MKNCIIACLFLAVSGILAAPQTQDAKPIDREEEARIFMQNLDAEAAVSYNTVVKASWKFNTNITDANQKAMLEAKKISAQETKDRWTRVQAYKNDWKQFKNESLRRQFKFYSELGTAALETKDFGKLTNLTTEMNKRYGTGTICDFHNKTKCDLLYNPHVRNILKTSRNYAELTHVWSAFRDAVGKPSRKLFEESLNLQNKAAKLNGYKNMADSWISGYESDTFEADLEALFQQLLPLYKQLHAYTRSKLRGIYGESVISKKGPLPAQLLGNMWAQSWVELLDILRPYPDTPDTDITAEMVKQNYTVTKMFQMADDFFASLNLKRVPASFWEKSMLVKPANRDVVCHASAWDFYDGKDVRIKQCTEVNLDDFETVHHEMGHIQYFLLYKDQPVVFRRGANPGFHEAVGDVMSLSVVTPEHLNLVGLLKTLPTDDKSDLNFLMRSGIQRIAFVPFGYLMDKFRWDAARGIATPQNYTCAWWKYRNELQGVKPPVLRTEADFDPSAKYHTNTYTPYVRYFCAYVLQYQFHKAACIKAGKYDPADPKKPLHRCDIYGSPEAGKILGDMLKLGREKHWHVALKAITGSEKMDASAFLEYYEPLHKWLKQENAKNNEFVGWEGETENFCQPPVARSFRTDFINMDDEYSSSIKS